jgi:hypothetical protein
MKIPDHAKTIQNLVSLCDELRQPFNNHPTLSRLYWRACNALNRIDETGELISLSNLREDGLND